MKKLFSFLLVTLMLLSPFATCVNADSIAEQAIDTTNTPEEKLTADLQEYLLTAEDDEYIPIYIWLNDYGEDTFYATLSKRLGRTVTADTEEAYIQDKIKIKEELLLKGLENLAKLDEYKLLSMSTGTMDIKNLTPEMFKLQANLTDIMTDEEIDKCIDSDMSSTEIITLSERNQFLSDYRNSRKTVNTAVNTTFYDSLDLDECRNVYLDPLLCRVTMECKKSYIDDVEDIAIVREVGYFEEIEFVEESVEEAESSSSDPADITEGQPLVAQNTIDGTTYTGAGIKVGVIEVADIDTSAPHLSGRGIEEYYVTPKQTGTTHATAVVSILAGSPIMYSGSIYQGIAPGASVFFAGGADTWYTLSDDATEEEKDKNTILARLNWLIIEKNCDIINMSMGSSNNIDGKYSDYENAIDELITQYRVVIVKSAGNKGDGTGYITKPGMSYNAIVVGNVNGLSIVDGKYEMKSSSSYKEYESTSEIFPNKPDVSAFGTQIIMLNKDGIPSSCFTTIDTPKKSDYITGTSFAAPQVAGAVALMMQANPDLIGDPDTVKALLLNSADENAISETETVSSCNVVDETKIYSAEATMKEKSGAGLLNIEAAIRMAKNGVYYPLVFNYGLPYFISESYVISPATQIEITLVYEKNTDYVLGTQKYENNLNIQILDSNDNVVMESTDETNNVESFKVIVDKGDWYKFKIVSDVSEDNIDELYATFTFSCHCKDKVISQSDCENSSAHYITCDMCGFSCVEPLHVSSKAIALSNGITVYFADIYMFERGNRNARNLMCDIIVCDYSPPSDGGLTVQSLQLTDRKTTQTVTGEKREYYCSVTFEQDGIVQTVSVKKITVITDYFAKTVTIS